MLFLFAALIAVRVLLELVLLSAGLFEILLIELGPSPEAAPVQAAHIANRALLDQWIESWSTSARLITTGTNFVMALAVISIGFPRARRVLRRNIIDETFG